MTRLVLGIDPSTIATGWALIRGMGAADLIDYGTIKRQTPKAVHYNLQAMLATALDLDASLEIAVETPYVYHNVKTTLLLAKAGNAWTILGGLLGIPCAEYKPDEWRKLAYVRFSKKMDPKRLAFDEARLVYGLDGGRATEHAVEAMMIARAHLIAMNQGEAQ